ncbi:glycosyltransferase [uncultured Mailhella sp.]|uniref:glycosyltransferase family 2 protein n=1 Tax=uncultured Mailhella sp. TaxID=1981031 RepID=UPI0025D46F94|nr:glycosyltransferase [uncultured Mailhella sp.]
MPRVSILMPVYNTRPEHLREAMDSMLAQTFTDFEFLILNDCSTDPQVEEVVKSYHDPRIVYAVNERNLGISGSRNRLLDMAQGEYIAVMDHDDISLPERLEKEVAFLDEHPDVGLVGCQFSTIGGRKTSQLPLDDVSLKKSLMIHCGGMCHPASMIRRSVLIEHGIRYEAIFSPAEDHALFCRMIPYTCFATLPEALFQYRAWEGNTSHSQAKKMESAKQGVLAFARRDNPELWAMARTYLVDRRRYRLFGIPVITRVRTWRETRWLLFECIPVWGGKDRLPKIQGL